MDMKKIHSILIAELNEFIKNKPDTLIDIAIIGSTSGHYGWDEKMMGDTDLLFMCTHFQSSDFFEWLNMLLSNIKKIICEYYNYNIDISYRAIDGPYKLPIYKVERPALFLHILLNTPENYLLNRGALITYTWSKYDTLLNSGVLKKFEKMKPTKENLLFDDRGINKALSILENDNSILKFIEYNLDNGEKFTIEFDENTLIFSEYLMHMVVTIARHIARSDQYIEADTLSNQDYALWYASKYDDYFVTFIYNLKYKVSVFGYLEALKWPLKMMVKAWLKETRDKILYEIS